MSLVILTKNKIMNHQFSLHPALTRNNVHQVKKILESKSEFNISQAEKNQSLIYAVKHGYTEIVALLINAQGDVNCQVLPHFMTPLMFACSGNHSLICQILIDNGADINLLNDDETSALMIASHKGYVNIVEMLLKNNAQVNHQDLDGDNALFLGIKSNHQEIVSLLIDFGADLYVDDGALSIAIDNNNLMMINLLLHKKVNVNQGNRDKITPLMMASAHGNRAIVERLLQAGADVNHQDITGDSSLHLAVLEEHLDIVELLLKAGAKVNIINQDRDSPLLIATLQGYTEIVRVLLAYGANPNFYNQQDTPLGLAVVNGWQKIALCLIQSGADPNTRLGDGKTVLMKACDQNNLELISHLLKAQADVNLEDKGGGTALMWAAHRGYLEAVKLLVKVKGIKIHHKNQGGYTAASLAEYNHYPEVARFLNS
jgi:uncharacterized protein